MKLVYIATVSQLCICMLPLNVKFVYLFGAPLNVKFIYLYP